MTADPGRYDGLDPDGAGRRIGELLDELVQHLPPESWTAVAELTRLLTSVHGAALERMLIIAASRDGGDDVVAALTADPLVKSLLIVHDLLPDDLSSVSAAQPVQFLPRRSRP